jgi:dTDP-4-amino-4,6-dideoxygalactose transaminase
MALKIPALNLEEQYRKIGQEIEAAVITVLRSGKYILSDRVAQLEAEIANISGCKHGIGVANGSDALHLSLWCLGIEAGDEVITTPFTFAATASAIILRGARPVFVDIDDKTYNIDVRRIESAITPKTKAIMPVHLFGLPSEMDQINEIARRHSLHVIEDNAQAIGAKYKGKPAGSLSDLACISFYPTKNLGACGDAGMIVTNNDILAERLRLLRAHGMKRRYYHDELGLNSRLDEVQAAILLAKFPYLKLWNASRQLVAEYYAESLQNISGIAAPQRVAHSADPETETTHTWHQYTIRVLTDAFERTQAAHFAELNSDNLRDTVMTKLAAKGIGTMCYYPVPLHIQSAFKRLGYKVGDFPVTEKVSKEVISLPMYPELNESHVNVVVTALREVIGELAVAVVQPVRPSIFAN